MNILKASRLNTAAIFCTLATATAAAAQDYPSHPIRVVIPFPPGGFVDTVIRSMGPGLSKELGQPVVVENRPGGGAQIAASAVKNSPADGYTVFAAESGTFAINPTLYEKLSYDPKVDFEPLAALVDSPMVMYTSPEGKLKPAPNFSTMFGKQDVFYSSTGPGTGGHILGHLLSKHVPTATFTHVPYKGAPAAIMAVLGKDVDFSFDAVAPTLDLARTHRGTILAIAGDKRSPYFPDVPTTAELGAPDVRMQVWIGTAVKKGTPAPIVERLEAAFNKAIDDPEVLKKFTDQGWSRFQISREGFGTFISQEIDRYRPVIKDSGAVVN